MNLITVSATVLTQTIRDQFELDRYVQQLDLRLADLAAQNPLPQMILDVVRFLAPRGRLVNLVNIIAADMPENVQLKLLVEQLAAQRVPLAVGAFDTNAALGLAEGDPITTAIRELVDALDDRMERFGYMNAYKRLHDLLHGLHREYGVIDLAVQQRMRDPSLPLSRDAEMLIKEWINDANETCGDLEFRECKPDWIESLGICLESLTSSEPERWNWALVELRGLPAREMRPLNEGLVDNASRLNFKSLSQCSNAVLLALAGCADDESKDIAKTVDVFNTRCIRVSYLVRIHNLCQRIDERLSPLPQPVVDLASKLLDWRPIMMRLAEIKKLIESEPTEVAKLGDIVDRIVKTVEAADRYQAATSPEEATLSFSAFRENFNDLFDATDKGVLKNSSDIGSNLNRLVSKLKAKL